MRRTSTDRMVSRRHRIITAIEDRRMAAAINIRLSVTITQDPITAVMVIVMSSSRYDHMATIRNPTIMSSMGGH